MARNPVLKQVPLLSGLPPETLTMLEPGARRRTYRRGEVIFHKGDPGNSMFLILEGQVKIVLPSEGGQEALLGVLDAGDCFGELSIIDAQPRSATIVATTPTVTLMVHRDDFERVLEQHPHVAIQLLQVLAHRLRGTDELAQDAVFLDVRGRLAKKLLELAASYGTQGAGGTVIGMRLTQSELATMVGATRESVNKHLRFYEGHGIIEVDRQRITVLNPEELKRRIY
jgi:CRP/FNR family transcriptional regulator/CRP/FNR family cyclic AMP-dependent transcriptional regulator